MSVIFTIFTELCDHHHCLITEHFYHFQKKPMPISSHSSFTLPPAPGNHESTFCLCRFSYSRHIQWMASYNMWSFVTGFFHLALTKYIFWSFIFEGRWVGLDPGSTASWLCGIRQMAWPLWAQFLHLTMGSVPVLTHIKGFEVCLTYRLWSRGVFNPLFHPSCP